MPAGDEQLHSYLAGLKAPPAIQMPPGHVADPQLIALDGYLQARVEWLSDAPVVDYGCGYGIVPHAIERLWDSTTPIPRYVGVDFAEVLPRVELGPRVRDSGELVDIEHFFEIFPALADEVAAVIIRNVLHEMDIADTGRLFAALSTLLPKEADIYIQEMNVVNPMERLNPGWDPDVLRDLLKGLGFVTFPVVKKGVGTPWFVLIARSPSASLTPEHAGRAVARAREQQRENNCVAIARLREPKQETETEYTMLAFEIAAIARQLQAWSYTNAAPASSSRDGQIPLAGVPVGEAKFFSADARKISGAVAVLTSKNIIDFPRLLGQCSFAFFSGYSERSLFTRPETLDAIEQLLSRGGEFRLLLCHPDSDAVRSRSSALVYENKERLRTDIINSIAAFDAFRKRIGGTLGAEALRRCELRLTDQQPPCAYFFVDQYCFTSLYTSTLSGGSGQTIVFEPGADEVVSHYDLLMREFTKLWEQSSVQVNS